MDLTFLESYEEETALGPIQREEALFLYALARVIRPQVVVEFGVAYGDSARVWLEAGVPLVIGFDPWSTPQATAVQQQYGERFRYLHQPMQLAEFEEQADIIFFDAAHDLAANIQAYNRLRHIPAMIAVHDTGTWAPEYMTAAHRDFPGVITPLGKVHQPQEPLFCDTLEKCGWRRMDFHSRHTLRHGITLLQPKP
jgi:hypothetical protein